MMGYTTLGEVTIYWESHGQGEPLLLISGVGGGTWTWEEPLAAWSSHFRVITFDNMGCGRSSMPDRVYRIEEMAEQAAAVLSAAGEEKGNVIGLSMGGMIAQELCLNHPSRVSRLVLGCTHCGGNSRIPPPPEVIERFADNEGLSPEEIIEKDLTLMVSSEFLESGAEALARYKERQLRAPLQPAYALQRQLAAIRTFDACDRIGSIGIPTMIIVGEGDVIVPPENGRLLAARIPGAVLENFTDSGHLLYLECGDAFQKKVMQFLKTTVSAE
jgi:pimeloyl-ACP methyl ester carboxylesterase